MKAPKLIKNIKFPLLILLAVAAIFSGLVGGFFISTYYYPQTASLLNALHVSLPQSPAQENTAYQPQTTQEEAVINVVKKYSPAVVSIVITKDVPIFEQYYANPFEGSPVPFDFQIPQLRQKGTEKQEIGGGTGFIISSDGIVLTNKHVVIDQAADYTVYTNDGGKFSAKVLARDPLQDLGVLKIDTASSTKPFPVVQLGDSSDLQIGQTVVAIGNALGEFRNTISVGVISGLGRTITASGSGDFVETIEDVIQTDAAINQGNSGGPLLNLKGEVIGINTATVVGAQNIGFAIPVNKAKKDIEQVKATGKIVYPFLGVYYILITDNLQKNFNLPVDYGVWIGRNADGTKSDSSIFPNSPADKAGLKQGDIILEINGEKITADNSLSKIIQNYNPGDKVALKIISNKAEKTIEIVLGEKSE